ncbi:hypothetical protein [Paenibacillus polymyxa]|nr:hypothetical protein [Paenibacillus polymyxa]
MMSGVGVTIWVEMLGGARRYMRRDGGIEMRKPDQTVKGHVGLA